MTQLKTSIIEIYKILLENIYIDKSLNSSVEFLKKMFYNKKSKVKDCRLLN